MTKPIRKNVLLLFAKLPEAGKVKTRLSILKDGVFSPEDASILFQAMLLDVIETSLKSFNCLKQDDPAYDQDDAVDEYSLVVSTSPAKNVTAMEALIASAVDEMIASDPSLSAFPIKVIADQGTNFDEHYNDAFSQVWGMGANCILSMGADMPALTVDDVVRGFRALHDHPDSIVISPDQEMGVSIIGWNSDISFDHAGVFYNPTGLTVLPAYIEKARSLELPIEYLPPVPDVDTIADLAHNVTLIQAILYSYECKHQIGGPYRTAMALRDLGVEGVRVPPNELRDSRSEIDR